MEMASSAELATSGTTKHCQAVLFGLNKLEVTADGPVNDITVLFSDKGVFIRIYHKFDNINCCVLPTSIVKVSAHFGSKLHAIVMVTEELDARWLKRILKDLKPQRPEHYQQFAREATQSCITFLIESFYDEDILMLQSIFGWDLMKCDNSTARHLSQISATASGENLDFSLHFSANVSSTNESCVPRQALGETTNGQQNKAIILLKHEEIAHELCGTDIETLAPGNCLNDQIIDFWLSFVHQHLFSPQDRARTHVFSQFFYTRLTQPMRNCTISTRKDIAALAQKRHEGVRRWTKNMDIFAKDFLIIPINTSEHWILAIICFPGLVGVQPINAAWCQSMYNGNNYYLTKENRMTPVHPLTAGIRQPCILIFDSFASAEHSEVFTYLAQYLRVEFEKRKGWHLDFTEQQMPTFLPTVPQQPNFQDCGIYALQFAETFFLQPIQSCKALFGTENWFTDSIVHTKREEIYNVILKLVDRDSLALVPALTFPSVQLQNENEDMADLTE